MSDLGGGFDMVSAREKQRIAGKALQFVYPGLKFSAAQIQPKTAIIALYLARALDGTSRATYGAFKFYSSITTGLLKGQLAWSDIPRAALDAAEEALDDDEPQRNAISAAFIRSAAPQRLMQLHLNDPETFPCPELEITPGAPLHDLIFERKGIFEVLFGDRSV